MRRNFKSNLLIIDENRGIKLNFGQMLQSKPFLVYKSSAGSGKTFTLAKVFLSIALRSNDPMHFKRILAITFTVKAANEMKDRIISYLSSISRSENASRKDASFMKAALMEETGLSEAAIEAKCSEILKAVLHNYGDLSVLTIDKFFTRLVKSFASELTLAPDFEIEIDQRLFVDQIIELLYAKVGENSALTELILAFLKFRLNDEQSGNLNSALEKTAHSLLTEEFFFIEDKFKEYAPHEIFEIKNKLDVECNEIAAELISQAQTALDLIQSSGLVPKDLAHGEKGIYSFFNKVHDEDFGQIISPGAYTIKTLEEDKWQSGTKHPTILKISHELRSIAESLLGQHKNVKRYLLLNAVKSELFRLGLIGELKQLMDDFKDAENMRLLSDFNRMISKQFLQEQTPFIYERLGNQYESILIDEFQDTSNLQWQNLIPLVENSLSEAKTSLIVGDAKQSIYRFRGSEPKQFIDLPTINHSAQSLFSSSYQQYILNSNFRSARNVIDFNNRFFDAYSKKVLSSEFLLTYADLKQEFVSKEIGEVNWWFASDEEVKGKEAVMQLMINRTIDLVTKQNERAGEICCLFRLNDDAALFASALLKHGLNVISEESLLLKNNPSVALLISTLNALRYPKDVFHLQQWLSKYHHIHRLDDYHRVAQQLKKEKWNLEQLMEKVGVMSKLRSLLEGEMFSKMFNLVKLFKLDLSNPFILKLLDFCSEYETSASYLKTSFLDHWEKSADALSIQLPEGKNAIRVMTIHKSKGLEFPTVMVYAPNLAKKNNTQKESWISLENELDIPQISLTTSALKGTEYEEILELENEKSTLDHLNMFYVAFTRAETKLEVFSELKSSKSILDTIETWKEWDSEKQLLHFGN